MADLNEEQLKRAEARGRKMLETEPRAAAAYYDAARGCVASQAGHDRRSRVAPVF